jgi:site-specific recombinase XerC
MTELLYSSGLRVAELVGLDLRPGQQSRYEGRGWVDLESGDAHVQGKGGKRRSTRLMTPRQHRRLASDPTSRPQQQAR